MSYAYKRDKLHVAINLPLLTFSQAASPASPSPKLDEERERRMTATSGLRCYGSYESFIRGGSSARTLAASLLGTRAWFSSKCTLTWKAKVTKSSRLLFQLSPSTRRTGGIGSGLLATPNTMDLMEPKTEKAITREATETRKGRTNFANLKEQIAYGKMLPTPRANKQSPQSRADFTPNLPARVGTGTGLKLQPAFVEWMMGFPEGWTEIPDSRLLEMRLSRKSRKKL